MIKNVWRFLSPLTVRPRRQLTRLVAVSVLVGFAEAGVLVFVVAAALNVAESGSDALADTSVLGLTLSPGLMLGLAAGLGFVSIFGHYLTARLNGTFSYQALRGARARAIDAFISASWECQSQAREGSLQETMSSLATKIALVAGAFCTSMAALINLAAFLLVAAVINPVAMLAVVVFGILVAAVLRPVGKMIEGRSTVYVSSNSSFAEEISRTTTLAMELRVFGVEDRAGESLQELNSATAKRFLVSRVVSTFGGTLYRDLAALLLVGSVGGLYLAGGDAIKSVGTVVVLVVRGLAYAQLAQVQIQGMNEDTPNLHAFEERIAVLESSTEPVGTNPVERIESIELDGVGYSYEEDKAALEGLTLRIEPGEVIGVIGPSGGGKSTFVQLLLRLRRPRSGEIRVNGRNYEDYAADDWSRLVTLVSQEPTLMEASVAENISFLRSGIDIEAIERAADLAHIGPDVRKLPRGFETPLGARGIGLSGGQKQRVAIARALVGQPQLLVLDEPTSALDANSERLLQQTITALKGRVTMVIVAHRLTTLEVCDRLMVLEGGRITMIGTPAELSEHSEFYRSVTTERSDD